LSLKKIFKIKTLKQFINHQYPFLFKFLSVSNKCILKKVTNSKQKSSITAHTLSVIVDNDKVVYSATLIEKSLITIPLHLLQQQQFIVPVQASRKILVIVDNRNRLWRHVADRSSHASVQPKLAPTIIPSTACLPSCDAASLWPTGVGLSQPPRSVGLVVHACSVHWVGRTPRLLSTLVQPGSVYATTIIYDISNLP